MIKVIYCKACPFRGGFGDLARVQEKGKWICICPICGRSEIYCIDHTFEVIETTWEKTAKSRAHRNWIGFRRSKKIDKGRTWVFSDGSSTGSFASVVMAPGEDPVEDVRHLAQPANRNVGCEIMGVAMGLKRVRPGQTVTVVSDFLGTACWLNCYWRIADPAAAPRLGLIVHLIRTLDLTVTFVHHKGHQKDDSDFTRWNARCDELCLVAARKKALGE